MKFHLEANLKLSKDATEAKDAIDDFFDEVSEILEKGAPQGHGAKIVEYKLIDDNLQLTIESDQHVRAHDALLRIKKSLTKVLGHQFHIGIRNIDIVKFVIEIASKRPITHKIPYVRDIEYQDEILRLELDAGPSGTLGPAEIVKRVPDRIINLLEEKFEDYGGKNEHWELLWESNPKEFNFNKDPTKEMIKSGWIKHGLNRGQWIYGPQATHLFRTFEDIVLKEVIEPLGYNEMIFPKLVPWEVWMKSGHAKGVYPEIYYVCPPKTRDPKFWEEVIDHYKVSQEIPLELIKDKIDLPIGGLCYAQCPSFWGFLQGTTLPNEELPIKVFDRSGTSHRYESGGIHGIERVDEFHRIEVVWLGTKEQTLEEAEKLKEHYKYIFENILDIQWRMAWVTPWFMVQEGKSGLADMEGAGTVDYEAIMPYNDNWIEIQNLSVNAEKYTKGFTVKSQSHDPLWSGCNGVGLERWTSAFLSQKGLDPDNWPKKFRKYFGKMPEGIQVL